jgi:hypothetical protein
MIIAGTDGTGYGSAALLWAAAAVLAATHAERTFR